MKLSGDDAIPKCNQIMTFGKLMKVHFGFPICCVLGKMVHFKQTLANIRTFFRTISTIISMRRIGPSLATLQIRLFPRDGSICSACAERGHGKGSRSLCEIEEENSSLPPGARDGSAACLSHHVFRFRARGNATGSFCRKFLGTCCFSPIIPIVDALCE